MRRWRALLISVGAALLISRSVTGERPWYSTGVDAAAAFPGGRAAALRTLGLTTPGKALGSDELKRAYKQAMLKAHPDTPSGSARAFQEVKSAYEFLLQPPVMDQVRLDAIPRPRQAPQPRGGAAWPQGAQPREVQEMPGRPNPFLDAFGVFLRNANVLLVVATLLFLALGGVDFGPGDDGSAQPEAAFRRSTSSRLR
mmetsp:Transcript_16140/g.34200  ORF Transcript_16140/g.34200 Transcript_16140/m.34200 type:complete len:198 (+) Transcript_16140:128-721(+)